MTKYETTFILEPGLDEARLNEEIERVSQWIRDLGGEVLEVQRWGKRRLSYEILKNAEGIYAVLEVLCEPATVSELDRQLGLNESVLRTKVLRREPKAGLSGGKGSALGALLGALVIQIINAGIITLSIDQNYSKIIIGVAVILAVVLDQLNNWLAKRQLAKTV